MLAGEVTAPLLALLVVLSPLLVLLGGERGLGAPEPSAVTAAIGLLTVGAATGASILVVTALAAVFGVPEWHVLALVTAAGCASVLWRRAAGLWSFAFIAGLAGLVAMVVAMGAAMAVTPWTAWAQLASRPALAFAPGAAWVNEGRTVLHPTTLTFTETHRVTAVSPAVFRVSEPELTGVTVREWRLGAGDSLTLRAGDRLTIASGTRMRFEAGKRIPGAALSGVAWAEPRRPSWRSLLETLGLAVTLLGGAATLMGGRARATRTTAVAGPLLLVVFAVVAVSWGVYAAWFATDLGLGAPLLVALAEAPLLSLRGAGSDWPALAAASALVALLVATLASLRGRAGALTERWRPEEAGRVRRCLPDVLWLGLLTACVMLSVRGVVSDTVLWTGLGLGASGWAAPRWSGNGRGVAMGSAVGVGLFAVLLLAGPLELPGAATVGPYPALVAAPIAALAAAIGSDRRARPRRARPDSGSG